MKVLYVTPGCFDKGGISRYNRYQIQALRELFGDENVRVLSLYGRAPGDFEDPFSVYWCGTGLNFWSKIRFVFQMFRQAVAWNPDVILTAHVNFSGLALLFSKIRGNNTILNTYGLEVWSGLKTLPEWGLRNTEIVIADCNYTAKYLETEGLRAKNSVKVIWDCVDLAKFYPASVPESVSKKYGIPDPSKHKLIVTLGRIAKAAAHKGYDRLIKAFSQLHESYPDARLVLAGKGDWMDDLKKLAENLGVAGKVTFTGMVDEQHLPDIYRLAYIFSLASDRGVGRGEGIPLTPLEAMACRVPIIVGNYDGSQEAVFNDENGFVIDSLNIEQHVDKLKFLLTNEGKRNEMAAKASDYAKQFFSYQGFVQKHRELFRSSYPEKISPK